MDLQSQRRRCEAQQRSQETSDGIPPWKTVLWQSCSGSSQPDTENLPAKAGQSLGQAPRSTSDHSGCQALWAIPTYRSSPERPRVASSILARLTLLPAVLPAHSTSLLFPRRCGFLSHVARRFRHPLIIRRRLLQQFFSRFHLRTSLILRRGRSDIRLVRRSILRWRKSLIAPQRLSRQRLKLLQARQLLQIAQSKPHQKLFRCLVQNRPPHHFLPSGRGNQVLIQQRADHPRSVHPANLRNLRRSHRLLVSNHRQRLQRRHRKPQRRSQALDEPPHDVVLLRLRIQLVTARHRANLDPPLFRSIASHQLVQRSLHHQLFLAQRLSQLLDRSRLIRRINNRFECRFSLFVSHALFSSLRILCVSALSSLIFFSPLATSYLYSSSICLIPPLSSNTKSNILCFRTKISPNCFSCTSATACSFTISSTARNATIIACREGHASKN